MRQRTDPVIKYDKSHVSILLIVVFVLAEAGVLLRMVLAGMSIGGIAGVIALIVVLSFTYCVRVVVDRDELYLMYGLGFFSRNIELSAVESHKIVQNHFLSSWIYLPFGGYVLVLRLRGGGRMIVPAPDPKQLAYTMNIRS